MYQYAFFSPTITFATVLYMIYISSSIVPVSYTHLDVYKRQEDIYELYPLAVRYIPAPASHHYLRNINKLHGPYLSLIHIYHLDCGNFDDMLRKAFEHENSDSSYKANGIIPIYIHYPKLALLLTGTPGQIHCMLNSYCLLYTSIQFFEYNKREVNIIFLKILQAIVIVKNNICVCLLYTSFGAYSFI